MEFYKIGSTFYVTIVFPRNFNPFLDELDIRAWETPPPVNMQDVRQALQAWRESEAEKILIARGRRWGTRQKQHLARTLFRWPDNSAQSPYYHFVGYAIPIEERLIELDPTDPEFKSLYLAGCVNPDSET